MIEQVLTIENVNIVRPEVEVEEPPPNVANEINPNEGHKILLIIYYITCEFAV